MYLESYKQLKVWQRSIELVKEIYKITNKFPQSELYGLTSQMRRCSISIPSNIAEGYKRRNIGEYVQFLSIADASAAELETQIIIAKEVYSFIDFSKIELLIEEIQKMLITIIKKLNTKRYALNAKPYTLNPNQGFTLVEILAAMVILGMIFIFGLWMGLGFYEQHNFDTEFNNLISVLRKARNLSIANFNESAHGVYVEPNRYTVYQGAFYASRNQSLDEVFTPQRVVFSGLGDINFSQLSGDASASGTIAASYRTKSKTIFINYEGKIN